ncbi:MAG: hypothetical protein OEM00_08255 [Burkholderiaceae bacterium]|nr:hypothetical protein [Burkholderiaceae bacterium]
MKPVLPALCLFAVALAGCVATAPDWESRHGDAVRQARAAQVIDLDAPSRNVTPPVADGKATAGAQTGYASSYGYAVKEAKPPALVLVPAGQ